MKTVLYSCLAVVLTGIATTTSAGERYTLVKVFDRSGYMSYQVLSEPQLADIREDISLESRLFTKAMVLTRRQWKTDEETSRKSFPRSVIQKRKLTPVKTFSSLEGANKELDALEEKESRKDLRAEESAKEKAEFEKTHLMNKKGGKGGVDLAAFRAEKADKEKGRELEREGFHDLARDKFERNIEELKSAARTAAAGDPVARTNAKPRPEKPAVPGDAEKPIDGAEPGDKEDVKQDDDLGIDLF